MSSIPCQACGCTEYTCHSGYYMCNNCDMLSQEIGDQRFEFVDFGRTADDDDERVELRSEKSITERRLTSWECYNMVLMGLVNELINLGASKEIKVLVFQLWASYLQSSNVAFISKKEEKLPALSLGFRNNDVYALYGISNLKRKIFRNSMGRFKRPRKEKSDSNSESLSVTTSRSMKLKQRKVALDETRSESDHSMPEETLEDLEKERASQKNKKKNVVFKSSARRLLQEFIDENDEIAPDPLTFRKQVMSRRSKVFRVVFDRRYETSFQKGPNVPLTSVTLITILRVALQLVNDDIFLGDILRWISEGHLSVNQPEKFVPLFYTYVKKNDLMNTHRKGFQLDIRNFTYNLNLTNLSTPNLFKLAERYCSELCVPNDFLQIVLKLMVDSKVEMNYANYKFRIFPDYECRVMAFVLFVFKLLFSLDDFTEFRQSTFADTVNQLQQYRLKEGIPKLFSWNSWMKFMECRKSTLSQYSTSVALLARKEKYCEENVFLNHWQKVQPTYETTEKKINEALLSSISQEIYSLSSEHVEKSDVINFDDCPASVTPRTTLTAHVLKNHSSLSFQTKTILSESFESCSVRFAMDSKWCSEIAGSLQLEVEYWSPDNHFDLEMYERSSNSFLPFSNLTYSRCDRPVPVFIENRPLPSGKNVKSAVYKSEASVFTNDSKSVYECCNSVVKLLTDSSYWSFHECSALSVEDFEAVARKNFPSSFRWLLSESATMLQTDIKELYCELVLVESVLLGLYSNPDKRKNYLKINKNEW